MRIRELMTRDVEAVRTTTTLASVADTFWRRDCGAVPVTDGDGRVVGIVTDRDVCIALGTRNRLASDLTVADVMSKNVRTCSIDDAASDALKVMRQGRVRRLPVVDSNRRLLGIFSINDAIRCAEDRLAADAIATLKAVCEPQRKLAAV